METSNCVVLIIGGGAAGCRAAWEAKRAHPELDVLLAVDSPLGSGGSTNMVASEALGINAPFNLEGDGDTAEIYEADTLETGGGLADPALCRVLAREAGDRVRELMDLGLRFWGENNTPRQQKLSGCTKVRSLTCGGETGREMVRVLREAAISSGVRVLENVRFNQLCQDPDGVVKGALGQMNGKPIFIGAGAVVLATGGASSLFRVNVTPSTQMGDGWAMAYNAGCRFVNMEFFQCGPAVMGTGQKFIIHSHMWRLLPKLTNREGWEFLQDYCQEGVTPDRALELKAMSYPFSVRTDAKYVDIAIFKEIMAGRGTPNGGVFFDVTHVSKEELLQKAPITYQTLLEAGKDLAKEPLELGIAVQNFNGGVLIDENGFTGVPGLYAAGEVTGGVHGSDRPGGNNLTDTQVFGRRAGLAASAWAGEHREKAPPPNLDEKGFLPGGEDSVLIRESEDLFYKELTVVRTQEGTNRVLDFIADAGARTASPDLQNRLTVGALLATAIALREESRGTHYREDFPHTKEGVPRRTVLQKGPEGLPIEVEESRNGTV